MMLARAIVKPSIALLLLAGVYVSFSVTFDVQPVREIGKVRDRQVSVMATEPQNSLSDSDIVETQTRPLFSASRRPFVAKAIAADTAAVEPVEATPPVAPRRLQLLGVNIFDGRFAALVQNSESQEIRWIGKGQEFDGWVLVRADKQSVRFSCPQKRDADCIYDVELYAARQAE